MSSFTGQFELLMLGMNNIIVNVDANHLNSVVC